MGQSEHDTKQGITMDNKTQATDIVILAAGQGSRMKSKLPKVLHALGGKSMVQHVIDAARTLDNSQIHLVVGHEQAQLRAALAHESVIYAEQLEQLGTGHAVAQALPQLADNSVVLILCGDVPLIKPQTLAQMQQIAAKGVVGLLTVDVVDATGYGRIIRNGEGDVIAIVEHKDASDAQREIREINTGIMAMPAARLREWLPRLESNNAQGEYYLTDVIGMAAADGITVEAVSASCEEEVQGVNTRVQLSRLERYLQAQKAEQLMVAGATLADPARIDIRGELNTGIDVDIDVNCVFEGQVELADNVSIGPNCLLKNCRIGANTRIEANSVIEDAVVTGESVIGPFARLRPGTELALGVKIGNFVETKKARIGEGSKVNHLSYIGDAQLGADVNIGAGTITCNYDGVNKSLTEIGDNAFIGSNTALVAPVKLGNGVTVAAGSVLTKAVADNQLAIARGRQTNIDGWARPTKKSK